MLDTWMSCPLKAKFRYIERLPTRKTSQMAFGICVHAALEFYNKTGNIEESVDLFVDYWDNPEKIKAEPEIWPKGTTHGGFRERGIELLRKYHELQGWEDRKIISQEHRFLVPVGEHEIQGVVDLIEEKKSARGKPVLKIVDYKTSKRAPYKNTLRHNIQFSIYHYASLKKEFWLGHDSEFPPISENAQELWEKYKDAPRRSIYFHLLSAKEIDAGPREDEDFLRMYRAIKEIAKAIEHDVFVPNISAESCFLCDFNKPCGIKFENQPEDNDWI